MKTSIICTVGTSLYRQLRKGIDSQQFTTNDEVFQALCKDENANKGTEIPSIHAMIREKVVEKTEALYLLTSETDESKLSGNYIKSYYESIFDTVEVIHIPGLQENDHTYFKEEGLRQLVRAMSQLLYINKRELSCYTINASGGYQAQVSFVGMIGQVLHIPVYYSFEDVTQIIRIPQLPITLDRNLWFTYNDIFREMYQKGSVSIKALKEEARSILKEKDLIIESDEKVHLSCIGLLTQFIATIELSKEKRKQLEQSITYKDNKSMPTLPTYAPLSFITVIDSILRLSYVKDVEFDRVENDFIGKVMFERSPGRLGKLKGSYFDGRDMWYYFIQTNAEDPFEEQEHLVDLHLRFTNPFEKFTPGDVEFILIRHAEHVGEIEKRVEGYTDFELTTKGLEQSKLLAKKIKQTYKLDAIYTSSLKRAKQTATIIGEELHMEPNDLNDSKAMDYGLSGGLTKFEAEVLYPKPQDKKSPHYTSWGSESELEFTRRVLSSFYELYYAHPGEKIAVVTHGRVIGTIMREVMEIPFTQDLRVESTNTSIHRFKIGPNKSVLYELNNRDHLINPMVEGDDQ